ncbi:trimeric intracellular cation channel family protein, partial [Dietzia cercidiphylli]|nr:trimeric intracellular cation channel family protein [Dietzia cercidiphylli]
DVRRRRERSVFGRPGREEDDAEGDDDDGRDPGDDGAPHDSRGPRPDRRR